MTHNHLNPGDHKVYIDLSFYRELQERFHAPGEFAQAYVIAHEVGHHVQNLLGISDKVQQARQRAGKAEANALSVRLELQADCLAGVWASHASTTRDSAGTPFLTGITRQDLLDALSAAKSVGDDHIQSTMGGGRVNPEKWTHGSSQARQRWFLTGYTSGDLGQCNTFTAANVE